MISACNNHLKLLSNDIEFDDSLLNISLYADEQEAMLTFTARNTWTAIISYPHQLPGDTTKWLVLEKKQGAPGTQHVAGKVLPNFTGETRQATIRFQSVSSTVDVEVTQSNLTHQNVLPQRYYLLSNYSYVKSYTNPQLPEENGTVEFAYDRDYRLIKATIKEDNKSPHTTTFTYGNHTIIEEEETNKGYFNLNSEGVITDLNISENDTCKIQGKLTYRNGYFSSSFINYQNNTTNSNTDKEYRATWNSGNLTKLYRYYPQTDKHTDTTMYYALSISNSPNINIDINYLISDMGLLCDELSMAKYLQMLGYMGYRCQRYLNIEEDTPNNRIYLYNYYTASDLPIVIEKRENTEDGETIAETVYRMHYELVAR
jgi:hypothetical protein